MIQPDELADLEEQRDFLLRSLDDLEKERDAGDIDDVDYRSLKDDYTRRAAEVLRSIDEGKATLAGPAEPRRWGRTLAVVAFVAVVAVGAGFAVAQAAGARRPGETSSGGTRVTTETRIAAAAQLAKDGKLADALKAYDGIVRDDPQSVRALLDRGLLRLQAAQAANLPQLYASGQQSIEQALKVDPRNPEAYLELGFARALQGDVDGAHLNCQKGLAVDPPPEVKSQLQACLVAGSAAP